MNPKKYLRSFLINLFALWAVNFIISAVKLTGGFETLCLAALFLTIINILVKPLIKLLLLPINLLTLGMFRWIINVFTLYLVTVFVQGFEINSFFFPGFSYQGIIIPDFQISQLGAYILVSLIISLITSMIYWLIK